MKTVSYTHLKTAMARVQVSRMHNRMVPGVLHFEAQFHTRLLTLSIIGIEELDMPIATPDFARQEMSV